MQFIRSAFSRNAISLGIGAAVVGLTCGFAPSAMAGETHAATMGDALLGGVWVLADFAGSAPAYINPGRVMPSGSDDDEIFIDGFDGVMPVISNYDDLAEGDLGTEYAYNGVNYHDVNGIGGVFPDGSTFTPEDVGDHLLIEDASDFYVDFPDFGSPPNVLNFGSVFIPGPNVSIGALVRVTMDLDQSATAASVDLGYYENGPWGGIEIHLDALAGGSVVASDVLTISDLGGRDNATTATLNVDGATFDTLKLYATFDDQPSAPRIIADDLSLTPAG